jgi:hypothetical protein
MRKIALTVLAAASIVGSAAQMATASEHHARKAHRPSASVQDPWNFRGAYNGPVDIPQSMDERNIENFGFSGRDPSRVGGEDSSLHPSGS